MRRDSTSGWAGHRLPSARSGAGAAAAESGSSFRPGSRSTGWRRSAFTSIRLRCVAGLAGQAQGQPASATPAAKDPIAALCALLTPEGRKTLGVDPATLRPEGHELAAAFLKPLPVTRIWGVGKAGVKELEALSVRTIAQLRTLLSG